MDASSAAESQHQQKDGKSEPPTGAAPPAAAAIICRRPYPAPRARLSCAAVLVGRYALFMGGFSVQDQEMGDVWVSDAVP